MFQSCYLLVVLLSRFSFVIIYRTFKQKGYMHYYGRNQNKPEDLFEIIYLDYFYLFLAPPRTHEMMLKHIHSFPNNCGKDVCLTSTTFFQTMPKSVENLMII